MSLDVECALRELLDMDEREFQSYFEVYEKDENIVIEVRKDSKGRPLWLERGTWLGINNYAKDKGGTWHKETATWTIPITSIKPIKETPKENDKAPFPISLEQPQKETVDRAGFEPATSAVEDESAYLRPTYEALGPITPVFRAPNGTVIDGKHRLQIDPGWSSIVLRNLNDPVKVAMARLVVNVVRRRVPASEKSELLGKIAKLTGWTPKEIADSLGMSYSWVMKYLPDEYKIKAVPIATQREAKEIPVAEAGKKGGEVSVATQREAKVFNIIRTAPDEVQPRIKEVVERHKLTPDETEDLVKAVWQAPKEKWSEVLLTPRTTIQRMRIQKPEKKEKRAPPKKARCPFCGSVISYKKGVRFTQLQQAFPDEISRMVSFLAGKT